MPEADPLLQEAVAYFRSRSGLKRLLDGLVSKYQRLGRLGGVVVLDTPNREERAALESFLRRRLPDGDLRLSVREFVGILGQTRFGRLDPLEILAAWYGRKLVSGQEQRERREQARRAVFHRLLEEFPHPFCQLWLNAALEKNPGARRVQQAFLSDPDFLRNMMVALRALGSLPRQYERLPAFARSVCGDPHGLDINGRAGKLFLEGLRYVKAHAAELFPDGEARLETADVLGGGWGDGTRRGAHATEGSGAVDSLSHTEEISELLYHFRLLRDDLLNFATCFGFTAYADGHGCPSAGHAQDARLCPTGEREIPFWHVAAQSGAPLNVPLREIVKVTRIYPLAASGMMQLTKDARPVAQSSLRERMVQAEPPPEHSFYRVFVVENSGVFSALLDECGVHYPPLLCLHGQFKLASWALLDRLVQSGAMLYYSGDFDPEGIHIAQKLLLRYPGRVRLWRMTEEDYHAAVPSTPLDEARLAKLKSVRVPELARLAQVIAEKRLAAYQEGLLDLLIQDLTCFTAFVRSR